MNSSKRIHPFFYTLAAVLGLAMCYSIHKQSTWLNEINPVPPTEALTPDSSLPDSSKTPTAPAHGFAQFGNRMAAHNGVNVVQSNGQYCLNAIRVAVGCNELGKIELLPGTDPRSIAALQKMNSENPEHRVDSGPAEVDPNSAAPQNPLSGEIRQLALKPSSPVERISPAGAPH